MSDTFNSDFDRERLETLHLVETVKRLFGPDVQASLATIMNISLCAQGSYKRENAENSNRQAISIKCSDPLKRLCAVSFARQESYNEFIAANPHAQRTLITRGFNGAIIHWFRCDDWTPLTRRETIWSGAQMV